MSRWIVLTCLAGLLLAARSYAGPANRELETYPGLEPVPVNLKGMGSPMGEMLTNPLDLTVFATGQMDFKTVIPLPALGPVFNGVSCAGCHSQPAIGGSGNIVNEIRVRDNPANEPVHIFAVDNMLRSGPQTQGALTIFNNGIASEPIGCELTSPGCQPSVCQQQEMKRVKFSDGLPTCDTTSSYYIGGGNCIDGRATPPLFGDGLVEAIGNKALINLAAQEPAAVRGIVKFVNEFGIRRVARFGWKDDTATLRGFIGNAYLNEIGVTNADFPFKVSQCALGQSQYGVTLQTSDGTEDQPGTDGRDDVDRFADFVRGLHRPGALPLDASALRGQALFQQSGCDTCHAPTITTAPDPAAFIPPSTGGTAISASLNSALSSHTFHPYSDFLLHDMGSLGDGMTAGVAGPTMMRTAPLWGLRARSLYLHDGRASDIPTAISLHDGQGKAAADAFAALSAAQQQDLVNFLNTL